MSQPTTAPARPATSGGEGSTDEELPRIAEGPVDLHVEDAEDVHAQAPEAHHAEVGDARQAELQVQQQRQADDHDDLEEAGDQEGVEPVERHVVYTFAVSVSRRPRHLSSTMKATIRTSWA